MRDCESMIRYSKFLYNDIQHLPLHLMIPTHWKGASANEAPRAYYLMTRGIGEKAEEEIVFIFRPSTMHCANRSMAREWSVRSDDPPVRHVLRVWLILYRCWIATIRCHHVVALFVEFTSGLRKSEDGIVEGTLYL
jgi:hypothetical protein